MPKILLTGGSGFIGSHFHRLLPAGTFINLDLVKPSFQHEAPFITGDIRKEEDIKKALTGNHVDTIISLAAKHHDFGIGHDEYFDTNEEGTRVICNQATAFGIKNIIFYSSVAVYGIREAISDENMNPQPDSPYGASKLAGEKVLEQWAAEDPERKVLIIRPTVVFGPNNLANMRNLIRQIDSGVYFHLGKADNIKSIAYVENVVEGTMFLMERMKPGVSVYNYADEPQLTAREISNLIAKALGKKIRITVPPFIGILLGLPFDLIIKLTGKNLPISTSRIKKLGTQTYHSAKKIFAAGFKPKYTTHDGIQKMVTWYKQE
ncbi:MAG TPA: NAD-dependent epimerase/dehydratase family protein [Ohtaekwangia sp.]|uniref:NAD-dependent epimerase/dehydratase family protein n=1 Tax=Ohtaekwangia sp. TaxID=2066019 RepID=UPI002F952BEC